MFKRFVNTVLIISLSFTLSGCKPDAMILFNSCPITKENLLNNATEFTAGKKFYYIFINQTPLKTNMIRVRLLKREEKAHYEINKLVYSNDFRLNKDQVYYYNDYLVLYEAGHYYMVIYARDSLDRPLASADFRIKN